MVTPRVPGCRESPREELGRPGSGSSLQPRSAQPGLRALDPGVYLARRRAWVSGRSLGCGSMSSKLVQAKLTVRTLQAPPLSVKSCRFRSEAHRSPGQIANPCCSPLFGTARCPAGQNSGGLGSSGGCGEGRGAGTEENRERPVPGARRRTRTRAAYIH